MFFTENLEHFVLYFFLMSGNLLLCWAVVVLFFFCKQLQLVKPHLNPGVPHDVPDGLVGHGGVEGVVR